MPDRARRDDPADDGPANGRQTGDEPTAYRRWLAGARLALTTFTVLPLAPGRVDRPVAAGAMALAPAVGAALGVLLAAVLLLCHAVGAPPLLGAVATVTAGALLTRGLHLDGLADTVDALGSYRRGAEALRVMKQPDVGPFGVAALVLVLLAQAAALATLATGPIVATVATVATAMATGRLAVTWCCRRGVPAARPEGLGALVAGTVPGAVLVAATAAVALVAIAAVPGRPWQGPITVAAVLTAALLLLRHAVRRLGGITGDVLGAQVEVVTTLTYLGLLLTG